MKKIFKQFLSIITLVLLFLVGLYSYTTQDLTLHRVISHMTYPLIKLQQILVMPIDNIIKAYKSGTEREKQIQFLQQRIIDMQAENIELATIKNMMEKTTELREFAQQYMHTEAQITRVLMRQLTEQTQFLMIDAGEQKNIAVDMIMVYKNCLVGRVTEVYPHYSKVTLITDRSCKVAAFCAKTQVQGIHEGLNQLTQTRLAYVNHLATLELDDLVLSSGEGLIFPRGFGLGRIKHFELNDFDYIVTVTPLLDFQTIEYGYIVSSNAFITEQPLTAGYAIS
jgi:rod shape-determining protein MreC